MKTFELLDVCYPDYFSGYHRPVLAVVCYNDMTYNQLAEALKFELENVFDGFSRTEILIINEYINKLKTNPQYKDNFFTTDVYEMIEEDREEEDFIMAYFSLCKLSYASGIQFCDH